MNYKDFQKKIDKTISSFSKVKPLINRINKLIKNNDIYIKPKFRVYKRDGFVKTKNAYSTLIMIDESYLPGVLTLGYSLRKNGCKNNLVCMVQDKDKIVTINGERKKISGVSKDAIKTILELYDVVYGVDLLQLEIDTSNNHFTKRKHYSNISLYVTKSQMFGLVDYNSILYLDASAVVNKNLDYMFKIYKGNHYLRDSITDAGAIGLHGAVIFIKPSIFFYTKALLLIHIYKKYIGDIFFQRGIDEVIIYLTAYPYWSKTINLWTRCIDSFHEKNCPIYHYQIIKGFKKKPNNEDNDRTFIMYDRYTKMLLKDYPNIKRYYEHIKEFRNTNYL
jgi:hypothetical protein